MAKQLVYVDDDGASTGDGMDHQMPCPAPTGGQCICVPTPRPGVTNQPSVREWAKANGYTVAERGRIAPAIHAAYREQFGDRDRPMNAARCSSCGRVWTGLRECHCTVCHLHFSTPRGFDDHRAGMPHNKCASPPKLHDPKGRPKYKFVNNAWGKLVVSALTGFDEDEDSDEELSLP